MYNEYIVHLIYTTGGFALWKYHLVMSPQENISFLCNEVHAFELYSIYYVFFRSWFFFINVFFFFLSMGSGSISLEEKVL